MKILWIGDQEVVAGDLAKTVTSDIDWLEDLLRDVQRELEGKQELLKWLDTDQA